jgi:hypothetical protein
MLAWGLNSPGGSTGGFRGGWQTPSDLLSNPGNGVVIDQRRLVSHFRGLNNGGVGWRWGTRLARDGSRERTGHGDTHLSHGVPVWREGEVVHIPGHGSDISAPSVAKKKSALTWGPHSAASTCVRRARGLLFRPRTHAPVRHLPHVRVREVTVQPDPPASGPQRKPRFHLGRAAGSVKLGQIGWGWAELGFLFFSFILLFLF